MSGQKRIFSGQVAQSGAKKGALKSALNSAMNSVLPKQTLTKKAIGK